jgi:hypothetical protein
MDIKFKSNKAVVNILHDSAPLKKLSSKVKQLEQLNQAVLSNLGPDLAQNCRVANLRNGILILATASPEWNHKLKFLKADLLESLRSKPCGYGLTSITIKTVPELAYSQFTIQKSLPNPKLLSSKNVQLINSLAESVSSPKLARALRKLGKHEENK